MSKALSIQFADEIDLHGFHLATDAELSAEPRRRAAVEQEFKLNEEMIRARLVELGWSPPWQPIETAPKDNKRLLHLAQMSEQGQVVAMDTNCIWEYWEESWEMPNINGWYWSGDNTIDEPTHWRFMDESFPKLAAEKES